MWSGGARPPTCNNPETAKECPGRSGKKCRGDINMIWSLGKFEISTARSPLAGMGHHAHVLDSAAAVVGPVQSGADVSDVGGVFVADPALIAVGGPHNKTIYIFTEVLNNHCQKGEVGLHVSEDELETITYVGIVLAEPWHLSFPRALEHEGKYYMTTSASAGHVEGGVGVPAGAPLQLYIADDFPRKWSRHAALVSSPQILGYAVDPVLHHHADGMWYLMLSVGITGYLFVSEALEGPYSEHPKSGQFGSVTRAGGLLLDDDGRLWSIEHNHQSAVEVTAREIVSLSNTTYATGPSRGVLGPRPEKWAQSGMHTWNAVKLGPGRWVGVVDGWWNDPSTSVHVCLERGGNSSACQAGGAPQEGGGEEGAPQQQQPPAIHGKVCALEGPSRNIVSERHSGAQGAPWPTKGVSTARACAQLCEALATCTAVHYYKADGSCYLHGENDAALSGPLRDGVGRIAGTCTCMAMEEPRPGAGRERH